MKIFKHFLLTAACLSVTLLLQAQAPENYYNSAFGKSNSALRLALQSIIDGHTNVGYDGLWAVYKTSDIHPDGKVWDMYSTCIWTPGYDQCGNQNSLCDCYNREHSLPKSWWGGAENVMYSDAFHLYPTDGRVNNQRSNYPFGECANGVKMDGDSRALGRLGTSTFTGYSGRVFEPDDQYKGDFARTYFYMATRYAGQNFTNGEGQTMFTYSSGGSPRCNLTTYAVNLFLKWHRQDPVSDKETDRNNAVFGYQHNRNPFIDFPELAEYIWGTRISEVFYPQSDIDDEYWQYIKIYIANNMLQIENLYGGGTVSVYNVYGQLLSQIVTNADVLSVPCSGDMILIVRIVDNAGRVSVHKIIAN